MAQNPRPLNPLSLNREGRQLLLGEQAITRVREQAESEAKLNAKIAGLREQRLAQEALNKAEIAKSQKTNKAMTKRVR